MAYSEEHRQQRRLRAQAKHSDPEWRRKWLKSLKAGNARQTPYDRWLQSYRRVNGTLHKKQKPRPPRAGGRARLGDRERMTTSDLEESLLYWLRVLAPDLLTGLVRQHQFCPPRKWTADFAWVSEKVLLEIDGNVHRIRGRWEGDAEKSNAAVLLGYRTLHITGKMIRDDPDSVIRMLREALERGEDR